MTNLTSDWNIQAEESKVRPYPIKNSLTASKFSFPTPTLKNRNLEHPKILKFNRSSSGRQNNSKGVLLGGKLQRKQRFVK